MVDKSFGTVSKFVLLQNFKIFTLFSANRGSARKFPKIGPLEISTSKVAMDCGTIRKFDGGGLL